MIDVLYFARLREQLGLNQEALDIADLGTAADVKNLLCGRGGIWAEVFADDQLVMVAVNQEMCDLEQSISDGDEVAFFPPVTGG